MVYEKNTMAKRKQLAVIVAFAGLLALSVLTGCAQPASGSDKSDAVKSSNADLATLTVEPGTLAPEFSAAVTEYTVSLQYSDASIVATGTVSDAKAVLSGDSGKTVELASGETVITLTVTAEDGTAKTTHITVTRASPAQKKVTFNKNADGATGTMADLTILQGASAALTANAFTLAGFTFGGWATSSTGDVAYAEGATYAMGNDDVVLYAVWLANGTVSATISLSGSGEITFTGDVTVAKGNNLVITVDTAGLGNFVWRLDSVILAGKTESTLTLSTASLAPGSHDLMVVAKDAGGIQYSGGFTVRITN